MKVLYIDRAKWGRNALMRADDKKRCCLGFCAISYGAKPNACSNIGMPWELPSSNKKKLPKWLMDATSSSDAWQASLINDDPGLSWVQKEERLKPIFLKHKIKLVFRGKRK